jgi:hypothetical protein
MAPWPCHVATNEAERDKFFAQRANLPLSRSFTLMNTVHEPEFLSCGKLRLRERRNAIGNLP